MTRLDARVPVVFGTLDDARADDAVLSEGLVAWPGAAASFTADARHPAACACCAGRSEAGRALAQLLHARARNTVPFFKRVLAVSKTAEGRQEIEAALANDPVAAACFRAEAQQ